MIRFPLRYARRNVLIGPSGQAAALYRVAGVPYPFLTAAGKWRLLRRLERLVHLVGADFSLWRVSRAYPADRYIRELEGIVDGRYADLAGWSRYLQGHQGRLATMASHHPEMYLAVSLEDRDRDRGSGSFVRSVDRARRRLEELAGVAGPRPISASDLEALDAREQQVFDRLGMTVGLARATVSDLQWLLSRVEVRGLGEPDLDPLWEPAAIEVEAPDGSVAYRPLEHDLWRCANAPLTERVGEPPSLEVETERGTSFQALLCVGALPEEVEFPGPQAELLFAPMEGVEFGVDAVLHARWVGNSQALGQVRKRILDVEHSYREQAEGAVGGPSWMAQADRDLAREYEAVLQSSAHPPMLYASISLAVGAADRVELERRVQGLREQFGQVRLHRPRGLQHQLFFDHLPRTDGGLTVDYEGQMTAEQFGALAASATSEVGSDPGVYIGRSPGGGGRPVRYDPTAPSRDGRTSAVLFAGTLGSGKTVAAQLVALAAERRGSLVVDFDPKPDHGLDRITELDGRVEVLELSGDPEHRGKLDPLTIGPPDLREELAASYLLDLVPNPPARWENHIQRAVRDATRTDAGGLLGVVDRLQASDSEAAREAGDALEVVADFGLARLGFGTGAAGAVVARRSVTTIRTPGLTLPDPSASRETYTRGERLSVATLALVAALALRLVAGDRSRHKVVLLDEAWFLLASTQGRALLNRLVRLGRAYNATVLLATQRLEDVGDLSDLVGTYFVFGQESDREAARALDLLGLDADDAGLVARLREFRRGRCLMRDLDGRVGEVQVDPALPGLLEALDTTPRKDRA